MPTSLVIGRFSVDKYGIDEKTTDISAEYTLHTADVHDSEYKRALIEKGFTFHDRILCFEINLSKRSKEPLLIQNWSGQDLPLFICDTITEDIFELAHMVFTHDRRFHLELEYNMEKAKSVIDAYLNNYQNRGGIKVFKAKCGNELLGFAIADEIADNNGAFFENVLGASFPGIKGKIAVGPLYSFMLDREKNDFKKYFGKVSSSNYASVNLHFQLGGHITQIYDEYIYINVY